ncbi:uncharacterized protein CTRU02_214539 [Colletotrichum truncatum]|uniref:Uncharacterized protein n=1 Tax=Colletotrichum truncatum TaxID=5467 RepID=A0ACC3YF51_COLTU|nr:uncharacterized protein CTRU02_12211 [Colletotrichum truncatum]KAF6785000.1 hypothetical protein CTRU02_12211 [Colletotrichum truncatum]
MKTSIACLAASLLSTAFALPSAGNSAIEARAGKVKFNQYRNMADCQNDAGILYHAAPVSGRCYDIDDQTGAFFYNPGIFTQVHLYQNKGCSGASQKLSLRGSCLDRVGKGSIKMW